MLTGSALVKDRALALAQPVSALLELTYRCPCRCLFCFNPRRTDTEPLSTSEWIDLLDDLRALGTLSVTLTGGEPMSRPDFLTIAEAVTKRAFSLYVLTNGVLLDDAMARELGRIRPFAVEVSLHGASAEVHDAATGEPGSHGAAVEAVRRLKRHGVKTVLKTPLTRLNEHELEEMIALGEALGAPHRIDVALTPRDDGDRSPMAYAPTEDSVRRLMAHLHRLGQLPQEERQPGGTVCGLGRISLAMDPEGNVYPCPQWRHQPLGNVRKTRIRDLWRGSESRRRAADASTSANEMLLKSGGPLASYPYCPALAWADTGDPLVPGAGAVARARVAASVRETTW